MEKITAIKQDLRSSANPDKIKILSGFFKTGKGQYGEGDIFIGVTVPEIRKIAKKHSDTPVNELEALLKEPVHEHRMFALLCMIEQFKEASEDKKQQLFQSYLKHTKYINNWDLVDLSAAQIVGEWIENKEHGILHQLAGSNILWEQRISIVATWKWIRNGKFDDTIAIAEKLLYHEHDLIRKAVGWMLREVGKKDKRTLTKFLDKYHTTMPRTTLRYAIEKFSPEEKLLYMKK